jgi:outer membrane protein assembly factor BamA
VRAIVLLTAVVTIAAWAMLRRLPNTVPNAEAALNRPVLRLQEVRSVALDGRQLPEARLREVLATRAGEQLDTARLERDREAMEQRLAELGYLAARVDPATVTFDKAGAAYVTFEIDQGKLFHLRTVEVTGAGRGAVVVTLTPGDLAVRDRIESARDALSDALERRADHRPGVPAVPHAEPRDGPSSVELSVHTDLAAAAVDVRFATH